MRTQYLGEAVPAPRRKVKLAITLALVALTWSGGVVAQRVQAQTPGPVAPHLKTVRTAPLPSKGAKTLAYEAPSDDQGGEGGGLGLACVAMALASIVLAASRLPRGSPERRALADAAGVLREYQCRADLRGAVY